MRTILGRASVALAVSAALAAIPGMLPAGAADQTAEVTASTVYASPVTDAIPRAILSLANPSLMCIFAPEACPPEAADVLLLASDPAGVLVDPNAQASPVQPMVPPDTIAVGLLGGTVRYQAAIDFEIPELAEGERFESLTIALQQTQPSYNISSPLFREVVNAALVLPDDPELGAAELQDAFAAAPIEEKVLDVRVCPLTQPFVATEAPNVADDDDIPHDEYGSPEVTCRLGSFGEFDEASGVWTFDVTAAANEWATGEHPKHGLFIQPTPINFVGLGDEDSTTFAQATLEAAQLTMTSVTAAEDVNTAAPAAPAVEADDSSAAAPTTDSDDAAVVSTVPTSPAPITIPPVVVPQEDDVAPAEVAPDSGAAAADAAGDGGGGQTVAASPTLTPASAEADPESLRLSALLALLAAGTGALALAMRQPSPKAVVAMPSNEVAAN